MKGLGMGCLLSRMALVPAERIGLFKGGKYLGESPHYAALGPVGESVGLAWGGRWKSFKDEPHYELKTGFTLAQMRERKAQGKPIA